MMKIECEKIATETENVYDNKMENGIAALH
jgi:hypothetical protein